MLYKQIFLTYTVLATTGCASVMNEVTQPIKVETMTSENKVIAGAKCELTNDRQSISMKSGDTVKVRRSGDDLKIACKHPDNPETTAKAKAISRANGGMYGNIILGGGIGAIIDHNKGTAYTYPTWVQLIFGKTLVFDRTAQKQRDQPTPANKQIAKTAEVKKPSVKTEEKAETEVKPTIGKKKKKSTSTDS